MKSRERDDEEDVDVGMQRGLGLNLMYQQPPFEDGDGGGGGGDAGGGGGGAGADRGRFSSGGSTDSSCSGRLPDQGLTVLHPGYEQESIPMDRPQTEIQTHYVQLSSNTPVAVDYHQTQQHEPTCLHSPVHNHNQHPHHHHNNHQHHQHHLHLQLPQHPEDDCTVDTKPDYSMLLQDEHQQLQHHQEHEPVDAKRVKREQARNYVKQKRLEIQQNDPEKYERLKEKNRMRRREKLKEIREDPERYEEMKRKQRERVKEQRERIKQNPEAYEEMKRKQREREKARRREIMSNPAAAAAWRERHRIMARERRLKRKLYFHVNDMVRQQSSGMSPEIKFDPDRPLKQEEEEESRTSDQTPGGSSAITPQQALSALIETSEPIQEHINKYFAELKRDRKDVGFANEKRGGRRKRTDSTGVNMDGHWMRPGKVLGLKMEVDWGPMGGSNSDSQGSSDDFGSRAAMLMTTSAGHEAESGAVQHNNTELLFSAMSPPVSPGMNHLGATSSSLMNIGSR
ncbi:unnamed protein product [Notodromas monacha]|uniref:Uncharacterized protein n=1 Tax=Notodromas monacha TaxID=399045 RepID=A0A7R9BUN1_9CRUS|nr:unnamed protein product [Notodromas monacha]CAG0921040.1 unnamed protein product [Notodromas monacha]